MHLVPGQVRTLHWMRAALAVAGVLAGLAGCVSSGGPAPKPRPVSVDKDRTTASDQTDAERLARTRMELAAAYFGRGQSTDALDQVKLALLARPDNPDAYSLRGLIYAALGDAKTAEDSFKRSLQLAPHNGDVIHNYGWFLCQQRRFDEADAQFVAAMAEPGYRSVSRSLLAQGVCQARAGNLPKAEHTLSHAYELDPANPTTAVNLSEVLYRGAQYERALFYIRRVNTKTDLSTAATLWLEAQIEHKLGQDAQLQDLGVQLHQRFPQAPQTLLFEKGRFDD
jgi:type IV pilus assembly protein PilF